MKKRQIVTHIAAFLMGALMFSSVAVASSAITVDFKPLKYFINEEQKYPPSGQQGFIYNGRTYVPLRFLAECLGQSVDWDGTSNSIYIGGQSHNDSTKPSASSGKKYMSDIIEPYGNSSGAHVRTNTGIQKMAGQTYFKGYDISAPTHIEASAYFNLGGNYTELTGLLGITDFPVCNDNTLVTITGDDQELATYLLKVGDVPKPIKLDVTGVSKLGIYAQLESVGGVFVGLYNPMIE